MSNASPPDDPNFDVSVEPAPRNDVVDVEEDEESKRAREAAALASTYDPAIVHAGLTTDEMRAERQAADARFIVDAAIVAGVVIAVTQDSEGLDGEDAVPPEMDDGGE